MSALRDAPRRAAGPKLRARSPRGDIRRQELGERPGHPFQEGGGNRVRVWGREEGGTPEERGCARDQNNPLSDK